MPNPSNLYAEKVFSEHPVGLWALDDSLDIDKIINIGIDNYCGIPAKSYGLQNINGYYVSSTENVYAKNAGIPMVYGASNSTTLIPNSSSPSLIIPGMGFLNEIGKYKDLTFEMWLRVNTDHPQLNRIFGNLYGTDGLYVNGPFLTLKVGNNAKSHFVGEWSRPMLVNITLSKNEASLLINGERVITIEYLLSDISFPNKYDENEKDLDWLAFYSYADIYPLEIDCVAVYPYKLAESVAKRRFIYGQGVESPENASALYNSVSAVIDYTFSNYSNSYSYPDLGKWSQGVFDNLDVNKNILSVPTYELPTPYFVSKTKEEWIADLATIQNGNDYFINMKPNPDWNDQAGTLIFNKFNGLNSDTSAIYGVFEITEDQEFVDEQVLFRVENVFTKDYISVNILKDETTNKNIIVYKFKYGTFGEQVIYQDNRTLPDFILGEKFVAGFHVRTLREKFTNIPSFFGKRTQLRVYLGGPNAYNNDLGLSIFSGNIYSLNFCTDRNYSQIKTIFNDYGFTKNYEDDVFYEYFDSNGDTIPSNINNDEDYDDIDPNQTPTAFLDGGTVQTVYPTIYDSILDIVRVHSASYSLKLTNFFGFFNLDISVNSYWQDYVPLSYLSKYIKLKNNKNKYDLDYVQFNISYPEPTKIHGRTHDSSNSYVKTYISFQYLASGISNSDAFFTEVKPIPTSMVVSPGTDWLGTKYEIVNNCVVYMPKNVNLSEIAMVMHMEFDVDAVGTKPVSIRSLQLSGQALNEAIPTKIGTKYGIDISPYTKQGIYYDFKTENPLSIYKGSTPHLYLTQYSGIQILGNSSKPNRGFSIAVNRNAAADYQVGAFQVAIRYPLIYFPEVPVQILETKSSNMYIKAFLKSNNELGTEGIIYLVDGNTGLPIQNLNAESGLYLYLNGLLGDIKTVSGIDTYVVTIEPKQWNVFGIQFKTKLNFNDMAGSMNFTGPLTMNFISRYRVVNPTTNQTSGLSQWNTLSGTWEDQTTSLWRDLLYTIVEASQNIDPSDLYNTFIGTNKIIVDDDSKIRFKDYQYKVYNDIVWKSQTLSAV